MVPAPGVVPSLRAGPSAKGQTGAAGSVRVNLSADCVLFVLGFGTGATMWSCGAAQTPQPGLVIVVVREAAMERGEGFLKLCLVNLSLFVLVVYPLNCFNRCHFSFCSPGLLAPSMQRI